MLLRLSQRRRQRHAETLRQLVLDVRTQVVALEVGVEHDALLVGVVARNQEARLLAAAADAQLVNLADARAQHLRLPVGALAQRGYVGVGIAAAIAEVVLLHTGPLRSIQQVELLGSSTDRDGGLIAHGSLVAAPLLGRDDDDAIGPARTVDGSGRHVLQHLNALNVAGVDERQRVERALNAADARLLRTAVHLIDEAVDDIQRIVARVDRVSATYADGAAGTGLTACRHVKSRHDAADGSVKRGRGGNLNLITAYRRHTARQLRALLGAVAHDHQLVQAPRLLVQADAHHRVALAYLHLLALVAHIPHADVRGERGNVNMEAALGVGHGLHLIIT